MKHFKRGIAVLLAFMLMIPSLPAMATEADAADQNGTAVVAEEEMPLEEESSEEESSEEQSEEESSEEQSEEESSEEQSEEESSEEQSEEESSEEQSEEGASEEQSEEESSEEQSEEESSEEQSEEESSEEQSEEESSEEQSEEEPSEEASENESAAEETEAEEEAGTTVSGNGITVSENSVSGNTISENSVRREKPSEEVKYNTGSHVYSVVGREDFFEYELGDACFEEDGSYTINIPEENPFFPYEVQFTHDGEVTNEWFMTPDDSVQVGGHTFYVSANFDGTVITQMSLKVGGDTVVVYPEEKEFTDGSGISLMSLQPLEERNLRVDLSAYTPVELTMVAVDSIFTGEYALADTDSVIWAYQGEDDYEISTSGDVLDLAWQTYNTDLSYHSADWEMIVGENDQLASGNIRYSVSVGYTPSREWLTPVLYKQDASGNRVPVRLGGGVQSIYGYGYYDYDLNGRYIELSVNTYDMEDTSEGYLSLSINPSVFENAGPDQIKVYEGKYTSAEEAAAQTDITGQIWNQDLSVTGSGYKVEKYTEKWVTIVSFDDAGNPTGCLPISIRLVISGNWMDFDLYAMEGEKADQTSMIYTISSTRGDYEVIIRLKYGYAADEEYRGVCGYLRYGEIGTNNEWVTAAYLGQYDSIAGAEAAGAENIRDILCADGEQGGGYATDYSKGVYFTIFVGEDGEEQERYCCRVVTEESEDAPSSSTTAWFNGVNDAEGNWLQAYAVNEKEDSYAEYNYLTIIVEDDADLTALAPTFSTSDGIHLYAQGSSTPEVSGKSVHDFSNGPVQYTAAAENGRNAKNYWLQIIKAEEGEGRLYINSFADAEAKTTEEGGVICSDREIMLDGYHEYVHDIFLANMGTEALPELSAELVSDTLALDDYWTLKGNYELSGCAGVPTTYTGYGDNLAKIRLRAKPGVEAGTDISGTLTIKSAGTPLVVLTLSGTVGDPVITTEEIPGAVKYVPYGTMIQNNNKYSWNSVSYSMISGRLPEGMTVRQNGEIYGVPRESGEFTFTVRMTNSHYDFSSSEKTFTLTVAENTDANVEAATDQGYELTQRIQDVTADSNADQTLVSEGEHAEFVDIYLDGEKLERGTDYDSESGSTRITIRSQTLRASNEAGTHTLGIEFRTKDTDILKRAAQNYVVESDGSSADPGENEKPEEGQKPGGDSGSQGGGNDSGSSGSGSSGSGNTAGSGSPAGNGSGVQSAESSGSIAAQNGSGQGTEGMAPGNVPAQPGLPADTDEITAYTVREGDSLWKISESFYGSGKYWEEIYQLNQDVLDDPNQIYAGQVLKINLALEVEQEPEREPDKIYYIVQKGDSLWSIAEKLYGQGRKWRRIYRANSASIGDPRYIYEGQAIIIP